MRSVRFFSDFLQFFFQPPRPVFRGNDRQYQLQSDHVWYQWICLSIAHLLTPPTGLYDFFLIFYAFLNDRKSVFIRPKKPEVGFWLKEAVFRSRSSLEVNKGGFWLKEAVYHSRACLGADYCILVI